MLEQNCGTSLLGVAQHEPGTYTPHLPHCQLVPIKEDRLLITDQQGTILKQTTQIYLLSLTCIAVSVVMYRDTRRYS